MAFLGLASAAFSAVMLAILLFGPPAIFGKVLAQLRSGLSGFLRKRG